jgi:hypothetical protein
MTINHRSSSRVPLALKVKIRRGGKSVGRFITGNINPYGAFIEMPGEELNTDDFVELAFMDRGSNILLKGLVKHQDSKGVGVLFAYDLAEFRTMLRQQLASLNPAGQSTSKQYPLW